VRTDTIVKTLHFDSETGMPQYDPISKMVLVNLQEQNVIVAINPENDTVAARYPVTDCKGNHGMALDVPHRRAFLVCEESNQLAVFDLDKRKTIASIAIPDGGDVVKFDAGLGRIYIACYSGAIAVIHEDDADHFHKIEDFKVQAKVHSLTVDPATHRVYAPEEQENGKPVARMMVFEPVP
jgi:DNA-binding beta-propeller fold protein YncE